VLRARNLIARPGRAACDPMTCRANLSFGAPLRLARLLPPRRLNGPSVQFGWRTMPPLVVVLRAFGDNGKRPHQVTGHGAPAGLPSQTTSPSTGWNERTLVMLRITTASLLGLSSLLVTSESVEACGRRCCRSAPVCCAVPACAAPSGAPAEPRPDYDAPPAPETAQNGTRQTYRAFSAEPTAPVAPAPMYTTPMRVYQPPTSGIDRFRADHKLRGNY
jgi:hypothetical protein